MNELPSPIESKKFVRICLWVGIVWFCLGFSYAYLSDDHVFAFIQIFLFSALDLVFIGLIFWELFFPKADKNNQQNRKIRIMIFAFFKLVCLGFLAITLKRLRNASVVTQVMGVSTIWIPPIISGLILSRLNSSKNNKV